MAAAIISKLEKWPEIIRAGWPASSIAFNRSPPMISMRPLAAVRRSSMVNSAAKRPNSSQAAMRMRSRSSKLLSGKASSRLRRMTLFAGVSGPSVRVTKPPNAEAASTGSSRNNADSVS